MSTTVDEFVAWHDAQLSLLQKEREAEILETSLLFSNCSASLLEKNGLALLSLAVGNVSVGLGGKSLIELERPAAHHSSPEFPPHLFRPGDIAAIAEHSTSAAKVKKAKDATASKDVEGVVFKVSDTKIVIAVRQNDTSSEELDLPERCKVLKLANDATFERMDKNLRFLRKSVLGPREAESSSPNPPNSLVSALLGFSAPSYKQPEPEPSRTITYLDQNLNESQRKAVQFVLHETDEIGLIHGPPGTGKTQTLVEVIRQLVADGKRVLVCGASNLAVDNLVERLSLHQVPLTRLGHPARIMANLHSATLDYQTAHSNSGEIVKDIKKDIDQIMSELSKGKIRGKERKEKYNEIKELRKEFRNRENKVVDGVVAQAKVILSTCHGAGGRQIFNTTFDVAIIDEAAQALEAVCWIPIMKAKKLILAGDHLQLSPTVKSDDKRAKAKTPKKKAKEKKFEKGTASDEPEATGAALLDTEAPTKRLQPASSLSFTMFDRLLQQHGNKIKRTLTIQYRMHENIMRFPSSALYDNELTASEAVKDRLLTDLPDVDQDSDICKEPVVLIDTAGTSMFERSDSEGVSTDSKSNENEASLVVRHVESLLAAGVAATSISLISPYQAQVNLLASLLRPRFPGMEIGSVDGFQGRENDVVIVSLVRSNEEREVGFLRDNRRLNVAMTRPRRQLVIVGDSATVSEGSKYLKSWMTWLEENADVSMAGLLEM